MLRSRLTRTVRFFALHYLARPDWSAEQNRAAFGPLCDPAGHGHDYTCTVTVSGPLRFGMVMDLGALDPFIAPGTMKIIEQMRHVTMHRIDANDHWIRPRLARELISVIG